VDSLHANHWYCCEAHNIDAEHQLIWPIGLLQKQGPYNSMPYNGGCMMRPIRARVKEKMSGGRNLFHKSTPEGVLPLRRDRS
jgi:hypothetical protein